MPGKKMGRPTDDPRTQRIGVRLTEGSYDILRRYCEQESVSKTEAIERGIRKLKDDLKK